MIRTRVLVIGLGGTISLSLAQGRANPTRNLADVCAKAGLDALAATVSVHEFLSKDSADITLHDIVNLADFITRRRSDHDAFVVTSGTDTLEEVAYGLERLLGRSTRVVVTGAMRPPYADDFDGPANVRDAVRVCSRRDGGPRGVDVVMGGMSIAAGFAHKDSISALASFISTSPEHPGRRVRPDAALDGAPEDAPRHASNEVPDEAPDEAPDVSPDVSPVSAAADAFDERADASGDPPDERPPIALPGFVEPDIPIVEMSVGSRIDVDRYLRADGLVIACPGAVSMSRDNLDALEGYMENGPPVVLVSRCAGSDADVAAWYPGYHDELEDRGYRVRDYLGLSARKARVKLALSSPRAASPPASEHV